MSVLPSPVASSASAPVVHDGAGGELHVERPHADRALRRDADEAEHLGKQVVELFAAAGPAAELGRLLFQFAVGERFIFGFT